MSYRCVAYVLTEDYEKAIADATEAMRRTDTRNSGDETVNAVVFFRAIAYAQRDDTLDKAAADLTRILSAGPGMAQGCDDEDAKWAGSIRSAILIRQGKTKTPDDMKKIMQGINYAPDYPDGLALMAVFLGKDNPDAAKLREAAKKAKAKPSALFGDTIDADIAAAVHKCLVRLVPEIEKKP